VLPIDTDGGYHCDEYGDFLLYHSRFHSQKRQHLAVEAMYYTKTPVKLLVAGADNDPNYTESIRKYIKSHGLSDRVTLLVGRFSEENKLKWLATCLGGFYLGEDEDYWAITTTEIMLSEKPVIAPLDTGATKYVVKDGITGLQPEGTPKAIAEAMDRLFTSKTEAERMGKAGNTLIREISPSWETVVKTLTGKA
jgi:glycosyltransferase involved in cell wall biosynthesis